MKHHIKVGKKDYVWDDHKPLDISIPVYPNKRQPNCFYAPPFEVEPVRSGDFVGSTQEGGSVNFFNVRINPHGNGTHTECVGHISKNGETINKTLQQFISIAHLVTIMPKIRKNGSQVITLSQLKKALSVNTCESLIIRTMPNPIEKRERNYSGKNPAYLSKNAMERIVQMGVEHLLIDLPSVDPEEDGGQLVAHKTFWDSTIKDRSKCTITELIFVDNMIKDGVYLLNIHINSFELDVSPSKPVLYILEEKN